MLLLDMNWVLVTVRPTITVRGPSILITRVFSK